MAIVNLDELDLLREVHAALRQIEQSEGVPHREAKRRALARLRDATELVAEP